MDIENTLEKDENNDYKEVKRIFSEKMKEIRADNKMTQEIFSGKLGVNLNTYKTWENELDDRIP